MEFNEVIPIKNGIKLKELLYYERKLIGARIILRTPQYAGYSDIDVKDLNLLVLEGVLSKPNSRTPKAQCYIDKNSIFRTHNTNEEYPVLKFNQIMGYLGSRGKTTNLVYSILGARDIEEIKCVLVNSRVEKPKLIKLIPNDTIESGEYKEYVTLKVKVTLKKNIGKYFHTTKWYIGVNKAGLKSYLGFTEWDLIKLAGKQGEKDLFISSAKYFSLKLVENKFTFSVEYTFSPK